MQNKIDVQNKPWTLSQKVLFRFFFIYLFLYIAPWDWLSIIPGANFILVYYNNIIEWAVIRSNANFFRVFGVKHVHRVFNGSGDTSFSWAQNYFYLCIAFIGCIIWSVIDRKRKSYTQLNYLLCLLTRYALALTAFGYGFDKVLGLQMPFPLMSQLATPLGDLLPMRFSWLFIGYSAPYEMFSGVMEVLVGVLLLWRRTATMGVLVATAVFINVMMLNMCYDIPVKLFSINLVLMCFYLLANEYRRITCFFVLNKPAPLCTVYHYPLTKKWMRITRIVLKLGLIFIIGKGFLDTLEWFKSNTMQADIRPVKSGIYDVIKFAVNSDTLAPLISDSVRWQDVIFDKGGMGSIKTSDTLFRMRYGRGYFFYKPDTIKHTIELKNFFDDRVAIISLNYQMPDSNTILLNGKKQNDSLFILLKKSNRHFQLAEKQFHWLSEANR